MKGRYWSQRRWLRVLAVSLVGLLMIGAGGSALAYLVGRPWAAKLQANLEHDLRTGAAELQLGSEVLGKANQGHDVTQLDQAQVHFSSSREAFARASSRVKREWLLTDAQRVPVVGHRYLAPRLAVVTHLADMGVALDDAGQDTAEVDRPLLAPPTPGQSGGQRVVAFLTGSSPGLAKINSDLARADKSAALVDPRLLPGAQRQSFLKAKDQIHKGLAGIDEFQRLSPSLLEILGANGPRTYLIEQVDPAELRGGGGFIGSYSLMAANHGELKLVSSGDVAKIDHPYPLPGSKKYIAPPNQLLPFGHGFVFGDASFSPDFPTNAKFGEALFLNETGTRVDGVISIDPVAVAALLEITGPIAVPGYGTTVQGSTFADEVFEREERLPSLTAGRKDFFPAVATLLIDKIANLSSATWPNLLNALNTAVEGKHLQVYFNNETAEAEMSRINWAGANASPKAGQETMLEVETNLGADKANHFLQRSYDLTLSVQNGKLLHKLVIDLKNSTPDGYLGGRHYACYLRFYYPAAATDLKVSGVAGPRQSSDEKLGEGIKLLEGSFQIDINDLKLGYAAHQVVIQYTTEIGDLRDGHHIYLQKQAGTLKDAAKITFEVNGKTFRADTDLGQDRLLDLTTKGLVVLPANGAGAHLPILGT